jgi:hypothetical protein
MFSTDSLGATRGPPECISSQAPLTSHARSVNQSQAFYCDHKSSLAVSNRSHANPAHNITPYVPSSIYVLILYMYIQHAQIPSVQAKNQPLIHASHHPTNQPAHAQLKRLI